MRVWQSSQSHGLILDRWVLRLADGPPLFIGLEQVWDYFTTNKNFEGPAFYSHTFHIPEDWLKKRIIFHAGAVSFHATVRVNGRPAGEHAGMWSPFQVELTPFVHNGENKLEIEVWKPGRRFPLRETLSGFLPDVATTFGGLWQHSWVGVFEHAALSDIQIHPHANGEVRVQGRFENWSGFEPDEVSVQIREANRKGEIKDSLAHATARPNIHSGTFAAQLKLDNPVLWTAGSPNEPYALEVTLCAHGQPLTNYHQALHFRDV